MKISTTTDVAKEGIPTTMTGVQSAEKPSVNETTHDEPEEYHNHSYDNEDQEPELHIRTYIALAAMFLLNFIPAFALTGPPTVLSYIGKDLHSPLSQTWIPSALSLVLAVLSPLLASPRILSRPEKHSWWYQL